MARNPHRFKVESVGLPPSGKVCDYFGRRLAERARKRQSEERPRDEKRRPVPAVK